MFLSEKGLIKLGDMGLASQLNHSSSQRSDVCGTYLYLPPETYHNKTVLKSDLWSLGISLIELAEGRNPYASASLKRMVVRICNKDPPYLSRKKWSPTLVDFVSKCLVKNVKERASVRVLMDVSDCEMVQA